MKNYVVNYILRKEKNVSDPEQNNQQQAIFNRRKMLEYLFKQVKKEDIQKYASLKLTQEKLQQISNQYLYILEMIHNDLKTKNTDIDNQIHKLQNQWEQKNIPAFFCYYFIKFCYANNIQRIADIIYLENSNLNRDDYIYNTIIKAIQARESCLNSLNKQGLGLTKQKIVKDLQAIQQQMNKKAKFRLRRQQSENYYKVLHQQEEIKQQRWKNSVELFFYSIFHLRKLTVYVIQIIKKWKKQIYSLTKDPKKYRQRVIFYHNNQNYFLKILVDNRFITSCPLSQFLQFSKYLDPFLLNPLVVLEQKQKSYQDLIFYNLLKPNENDFTMIIQSLQTLAEQRYAQDNQIRFHSQKKSEQIQKIETYSNTLYKSRQSTSKKILTRNTNIKRSQSAYGMRNKKQLKNGQVKINKNMFQTQELQRNLRQGEKKSQTVSINFNKDRPKSSLTYQRDQIKNFEKQNYMDTQNKIQSHLKSEYSHKNFEFNMASLKQTSQNKIFNNYIQQNLKKLEEIQKKKINKNRILSANFEKIKLIPKEKIIRFNEKISDINKISDKKQLNQEISSNFNNQKKNSIVRSVIEISNEGIRSKVKTKDFITENIRNLESFKYYRPKKFQFGTIFNQLDYTLNRKSRNKQLNQNNQNTINQESKKQEKMIKKQEPEKLEQLKTFLYNKIKQQLLIEMKKDKQDNKTNLNNLIQEQKRKRLIQIIEIQKMQQEKNKVEQKIKQQQEIERIRNMIIQDIDLVPLQCSQERLSQLVAQSFTLKTTIFNTIFNTTQLNYKKQIHQNLYNLIFFIKLKQVKIGYVFLYLDDSVLYKRKFRISYIATQRTQYFISIIHHVLNFLWSCDPAQQIELILNQNAQSQEVVRMVSDLTKYSYNIAKIFQKQLYSNIKEKTFVFFRNFNEYPIKQFIGYSNLYGKSLNIKIQILSANNNLHQVLPSNIDPLLQYNTHYTFIIQEIFRNYLSTEEIIQLRQNTQNLRRLKDIFEIVRNLEKNKLKISEIKVVQGLNMIDIETKIKQKLQKPFQKYYWKQHIDIQKTNRVILAILQLRLQFDFPINSVIHNSKNFLRFQINQQILVLKSSISPQDLIYVLPTKNQKLKFFILKAKSYKQMRIELFIFLNLLFKNMIDDYKLNIQNIWVPQIMVNQQNQQESKYCKKQIKRISDFSITMKKNAWLGEEIYFCNKQYIQNGISITPKQKDEIFRDSFIFGIIHSDVEKDSIGVPLFAKLIQESHHFN